MARSLEVLANAIKSRMKERGVTQVELQKLSKVTQSQLSQYLNRKMAPTLENLERIATALETTPADLLGGVTPPPATAVLQAELRARDEEILRLKVELAEARALTSRGANKESGRKLYQAAEPSDPPEVAFLRSLPPEDPAWDIVRGMMETKGKAGKKAK
jgi:transcriptional regulator with XRE-family HTH domain